MPHVRLALAGDVMIGRGVDQIMRYPCDPTLHERWAQSASCYVELAEATAGPLPRDVDPSYVWGDTLERLRGQRVDARIVNLETAVTARGRPWPGKGIHYRSSPENAGCLVAGRIDVVTLANNHVLDWSEEGLDDTLQTLSSLGVRYTGAGFNEEEAWTPAIVRAGARVVVMGVGVRSSGIDAAWGATSRRPGLALLDDLSAQSVAAVASAVSGAGGSSDLAVVSIHWGGNWGYDVPAAHREFARALIDTAGVDVVHGHSSHHPLQLEVYGDRLILYGCGDLLTDYEGIAGHEEFRPELGAWYLVDVDADTGALRGLSLLPTKVHGFRLTTPRADETEWLVDRLEKESDGIGLSVRDDVLAVDF